MDSLVRDLVLAARLLRRRAGFSALAITILAIAIGANSAIFSVVNAVLLRAPAFEDPERLVAVWESRAASSSNRNVVAAYNYTRWRERARSFTDLAAFSGARTNLSGGGDPERLVAGAATGNLFAVLGVKAYAGRTLTEEDSRPGAPSVAVLSEGLWRRRFGGDPGIVGRSITLDGRPATVVGVMLRSFQIPAGAAVWVPLMNEAMLNARGRWMTVIGRLQPEATLAQAREEMKGLAADLVRENPDFDTGWSATVFSLHADLVQEVRPALFVLVGAVVLLLLVGCANVANLLLARAVGREREVAIRSALGAGPGRLVRQLLTESLLLATLGGAAGLVLGAWVMKGLAAMLPAEIRLMTPVALDPTVVAFTAGLSVASAIVFGLVPALHQARPALVPSLKEGGATRGASASSRRLKNTLVVAEVALSLVLTAGTGLLLRSFWNLSHVDTGFRPPGVLTVSVDLGDVRYREPERQAAFVRDAVARLARIPGAVSAGAINVMPMDGASATRFRVMDRPVPARGEEPRADIRIVAPGAFVTMGVPFVAGRDFSDSDTRDRPTAVIVNRSVAQEFWPGQDPIGKRVKMSWEGDPEGEVIGVVGDVRLTSLDRAPRHTLYWAQAQVPTGAMTLLVRTTGRPEALAPSVRRNLAELDRELPTGAFRTFEEVVEGSLERQQFLLRLLGAFAGVALLLAAVGIYGVMSYSVLERVPEVGVRLAVGASPADIVRLVLREGLVLGLLGVGIGVTVATFAAGALQSLLFQVAPRDPVSLAAVSALLLTATLTAAWIPARRASRVDPMTALRRE
ncbi:MAG TPA: ABC transporter permease [Vicinamibacteria bacterium]|nr:ABC transporter permease [Vicinamibacteria bacterium]